MNRLSNPIGPSGSTKPVHIPPTGMNGRGEIVGCQCEDCFPKKVKLRYLLARLDDAICWRQKAMSPEDVVDGFEEVDMIKNKIIKLLL